MMIIFNLKNTEQNSLVSVRHSVREVQEYKIPTDDRLLITFKGQQIFSSAFRRSLQRQFDIRPILSPNPLSVAVILKMLVAST